MTQGASGLLIPYQVSPIWMPLLVKQLLPKSPLMALMDLLPKFLSHGNFFKTKLLDSTRSKHNGCRQETNHANSNRNNPLGNTYNNSTPLVKWTGKTMVMKKGMHFSPDDWKKVTKAQKSQIYAFKKDKKTTASDVLVLQHIAYFCQKGQFVHASNNLWYVLLHTRYTTNSASLNTVLNPHT
jgi:hypothetical protein